MSRPESYVVIGSGRTREDLERLGPYAYEGNAEKLGPLFARHGYVSLYLFRRGGMCRAGLMRNWSVVIK